MSRSAIYMMLGAAGIVLIVWYLFGTGWQEAKVRVYFNTQARLLDDAARLIKPQLLAGELGATTAPVSLRSITGNVADEALFVRTGVDKTLLIFLTDTTYKQERAALEQLSASGYKDVTNAIYDPTNGTYSSGMLIAYYDFEANTALGTSPAQLKAAEQGLD